MKGLLKSVLVIGQVFGLVVGRNFIMPVNDTLEKHWDLTPYA
jgi:hypothetical protein